MTNTCNVPTCDRPVQARSLCPTHYDRWYYGDSEMRRWATEPRDTDHWVCTCPTQRRDDWECPTCRRPSYSPERITQILSAS